MKHLLSFLILCLTCVCARANALEQIVPQPRQAELHKGSLRVSGIAFRCDPALDPAAQEAVGQFAGQLGYASGKTCTISTPLGLHESLQSGKLKGMIFLQDDSLDPEAYSIFVASNHAVIRSNGLPTYVVPDIAYHYDKLVTRNFDIAIDVLGADHHGYVPRLKAALTALGVDASRLDVVLMQMVFLVKDGERVKLCEL